MFSAKSRYVAQPFVSVPDGRGGVAKVVYPPPAPVQYVRGYHPRLQGQRLDHLAAFYLQDPTGYWRICALNDAMTPEMLTERPRLSIPGPGEGRS